MTSQPEPQPESGVELSRPQLRWLVYALLMALAVGQMSGRVLAVNSVNTEKLSDYLKAKGRDDWQKQRPFLSGNDRSRWATVRALVDHGTYAIDDVHQLPNWDTIDKVYHDGHYYSSKPPLLATLLAGEYWVLQKLTGLTLADDPWAVGRILLLINQVGPLLLMYVVLAKLVERYGSGDFDRIFVMACATFATFLNTFVVVLNNHLYAAVAVTVASYAAMRIWYDGERHWRYFFIAGFFAAFAAATELPALAFFGLLGLALLVRAPLQTLIAGVPGALVVVAGFFGTNYAAHDTFVMPYAHRGEETFLNPQGEDWYSYVEKRGEREIPSYWIDPKGIDAGEPEPSDYAFHVLIGHHGIFSLTPVLLVSILGLLLMIAGRTRLTAAGWFILIISTVVLTFYLTRPLIDRNYSGTSSAFRWAFWMIPLWLVAMLPAAHLAQRWRWALGLVCLLAAFSAMARAYPTWNPWTHPMYYDWAVYQEWIEPK